jgi:ABC-2 type transport system ATP-binding protein
VIITSHILGSLTGICDQIHVLSNGKITFSREKDNFMNLEQDIFRDLDPGYSDLIDGII